MPSSIRRKARGVSGASAITVGFYGKLPARGDFVRAALPRGFVDAWDHWISDVLPASRERLGSRWLDAWMVAPIWHFALPRGQCGVDAVVGLWMPSVDRAGRHFPFAIAATVADAPPTLPTSTLASRCGAWLERVEQAGLDALEHDLSPDDLLARLDRTDVLDPAADVDSAWDGISGDTGLWWTLGGPNVEPGRLALPALPDAAMFASMLDGRAMSDMLDRRGEILR